MHKWFSDSYTIPADSGEEEDERPKTPGAED
jgi:hypothetical protein